jgi:hypothetical protein
MKCLYGTSNGLIILILNNCIVLILDKCPGEQENENIKRFKNEWLGQKTLNEISSKVSTNLINFY